MQVEPTRATGPAVTALRSHYTGMSQAIKQIWVEEGIAGFWRGTLPGQLLTVPYCAVQFVALQKCKEFAHRLQLDNGRQVSSVSFLSGAVAGMAATAASYPFDLLRTTLAAQGEPKVYRGMVDAARGDRVRLRCPWPTVHHVGACDADPSLAYYALACMGPAWLDTTPHAQASCGNTDSRACTGAWGSPWRR